MRKLLYACLALSTAVAFGATPQTSSSPANNSAAAQQIAKHWGELPLAFERNQGQTNAAVDFLSRGKSYTLFLTPTGATMTLSRPSGRDVLRMNLAGASSRPAVAAEEPLPGSVNYLVGPASQWKTGVAEFGRVRYRDVYPGVDLVYYGNQGQLEYDFVVRPGASAEAIGFVMDGATSVTTMEDGALRIGLTNGNVLWKRPEAYQMVDGQRRKVEAEYAVVDKAVAFKLGEYDHTKPVVIDPMLVFGTYVGGADGSTANGIAIDSSGNVYITGTANSSQYPTTSGAYDRTFKGNQDAFITKLSADGKSLIYSTYLGGTSADSGDTIGVDSAGNAYVGGNTISTDFPVTSGAYHVTGGSNGSGFITKLNSSGTALVYSAEIGQTTVRSLVIDSSGDVYATGGVFGNFQTTPGAYKSTQNNGGCQNVYGTSYVFKMNPSGSAPVYSTYIADCAQSYGIAVLNGNAYVTGQTAGSYPVTAGVVQTNFGGYIDAFVTELNTAGSALVYSTYLGGNLGDFGNGIVVNGAGDATIAGYTYSTNYPTVHAFEPTMPTSAQDATSGMITKLNATGTGYVYSTYLGGSYNDFVNGIAQDSAGNIYVTGQASSSDFPTKDAFQGICGASSFNTCMASAFVTKFGPAGSFVASTFYGPPDQWDDGFAIAADNSGNAYIAGYSGLGLPTKNAYKSSTNGNQGTVFVGKISMNGTTGCTNLHQNRTVAICTPFTNVTSNPYVRVQAVVNDTNKVNAIQVYLDGAIVFQEITGNQIDSYIVVPAGTHTIAVKAWDSQGAFIAYRTVTVSGSNSHTCTTGDVLPYVQFCSPLGGASVTNPVTVTAIAQSNNQPVTAMELYIDKAAYKTVHASTISDSVTLGTGWHQFAVNAWDWKGQVFQQTVWAYVH